MLAVIGLYLLTVTDDLTLAKGDGLVLIGAFFWAGHVLVIGWLSGRHIEPVLLACLQFILCAVLSLIVAAATESITLQGLEGAALPILYGGLLSVGVAYTLQVVAQRDVPPAHCDYPQSGNRFCRTSRVGGVARNPIESGIGGCGLMFAGMLLSQWGMGRAQPAPAGPGSVPMRRFDGG